MKVLNKVLTTITIVLLVFGASFFGTSLALNILSTIPEQKANEVFESLQNLSSGYTQTSNIYSSEERRVLTEIADLIRDKGNGLISDYDYAFKSGELVLRHLLLQ